jgi:signal transduction histidine kinase
VEDKLEHFRHNVSFITSANGILFIRYNVAEDTLYHLDNSGELTESTITLDEYLGSAHPDDLTRAKELLAIMRVHKRERFQTEYRYRLPGSEKYDWFAINVVACDYDKYHRISNYLCLFRNNNEWRKAMDEMISLRDKAESANKMKNAFLANMSHEIRTPLNAVVGFSSMITDEMPADEREKFKQVIAHNNKLLLQIVDDVLTLSKIESGDIDFTNSTFDINDFMQSIIDSMRLTIHDKVKLICQSQEHFNICFDSRRLTEVVSTLIVNANKFTPEGTITINYRQEPEGLFISITDTGIGIDKKDQERIFQRFEKVNTYVSGTGLGLSICKGIVEQAHGTIGVESEPGKGSSFWFRIPCVISK